MSRREKNMYKSTRNDSTIPVPPAISSVNSCTAILPLVPLRGSVEESWEARVSVEVSRSALQGTFCSLWHFLWTSNLHWVHLNPCRPSPQIRSLQNSQKARYDVKGEEICVTRWWWWCIHDNSIGGNDGDHQT